MRQTRALTIRVRICEPVESHDYADAQSLRDAVRARMEETQKELWKIRGFAPPASLPAAEPRAPSAARKTEREQIRA